MEWEMESDSPCCSHTYPRQGRRSPGRCRGWALKLGIVEQSQGEGFCWLGRDQLRGPEGGDYGGKCLWKKVRQPWKQGDSAESHLGGGAITIASFSPHASTGSWTVESGLSNPWLHWTTEQDPTQGAPLSAWYTDLQNNTPARGLLYVLDTPDNREGPQAREPSKCLNGQSYGERLAKEAFWSPATRGLKKDSDRATTPAAEAVCVPAHLVPPGPLQAKQLRHLHAQLSLGQSCHRQKILASTHAGSLR